MQDPATVGQIERRYRSLAPLMDERMRRQWAASEAQAYGWGGVSAVSAASGMSPNTIRRGIAELLERARHPDAPVESRIRRPGGGRKPLTEIDLQPLVSHEVIINLIASTATKTGLKIRAALDRGSYPTGVAIAEEQLAAVNLKRAAFHGEWNYAILPTRKRK